MNDWDFHHTQTESDIPIVNVAYKDDLYPDIEFVLLLVALVLLSLALAIVFLAFIVLPAGEL